MTCVNMLEQEAASLRPGRPSSVTQRRVLEVPLRARAVRRARGRSRRVGRCARSIAATRVAFRRIERGRSRSDSDIARAVVRRRYRRLGPGRGPARTVTMISKESQIARRAGDDGSSSVAFDVVDTLIDAWRRSTRSRSTPSRSPRIGARSLVCRRRQSRGRVA